MKVLAINEGIRLPREKCMFSINIGIRARLVEEGREGGMRIITGRKERREEKGSSSIPFSLGAERYEYRVYE